jgi:hypothetical protein
MCIGTAHIPMAEAGGYDQYLEQNFQFPEEFMALASNVPSLDPQAVVFALCEEALHITDQWSCQIGATSSCGAVVKIGSVCDRRG